MCRAYDDTASACAALLSKLCVVYVPVCYYGNGNKKVAVLAATRLGQPLIGLSVIAGGELVIAAVLCAYVVLRFSMDIVREARTA